MKKKLILTDLVFSGLILGLTLMLYLTAQNHFSTDQTAAQKVALNEIMQLTKEAISTSSDSDDLNKPADLTSKQASQSVNKDKIQASLSVIEDKINALYSSLLSSKKPGSITDLILVFGLIMVLILQVILWYLYRTILAPFQRMKAYTEEIAKGNFDLPLPYDRANYFGDFTWAFDHMRLEINRARSCEKEAIENNKTTIATLSHDLKTPIASIRAYAEGLEANLVSSAEKREYYIQVILRKCDEVTRLTNDLFYHSLADLDKLTIQMVPIDLNRFLQEQVQELKAGKNDLQYHGVTQEVSILADEQRLTQVIGNLITNARKYARTKIDITVTPTNNEVTIMIRDYGEGILDEDLPFVCNRFYRGKNCSNEPGAGLGLYIVDYLMIQMKGCMELKNQYPGLGVSLTFPIVK